MCIRDSHDNRLYLQGGTNGFQFRSHNGAATGTWTLDNSGNFYPSTNGTINLGTSSYRVGNVHAANFHGDGSNLTNLPSTGDTPTVKTSNYTASTGDIVVVNASNLTITLPSSPSTGDKVSVRILGGNFCNVARNGQKIEEQNEDLAIDTYDGCAKLVYVDSTRGWLITC